MSLTFGALTSDRVNHGSGATLDNLPTGGAFTVWAWVYLTSSGTNRVIVTKDNSGPNGWDFLSSANQNLRFIVFRSGGVNTDFTSANTVVPLNTWTFVAATFDDSASPKVHIYKGTLGAVCSEVSYSGGSTTAGTGAFVDDSAASLYVGNLQRSTTLAWVGKIQRVGIVTRALTVEELRYIQLESSSTTNQNVTGTKLLVDYEGSGTQTDLSGNSNDGTITGATDDTTPTWPQKIAVTDSSFYFSPYNWYSDGAGALASNNIKGSSTYALSNTPGAYLKTKVAVASSGAGLCCLALDTTNLNTLTASKCPVVAHHKVDGAMSTVQTAYSASFANQYVDSGGLIANGTRDFEAFFKCIDLNSPGDRWSTPRQSVKVTGLYIDGDASLSAPSVESKNTLCFGDSLWEGANVSGTALTIAENDAIQSASRYLSLGLQSNFGLIAFGGCGYIRGIGNVAASSSAPALKNATSANEFYDKYFSGASRLVSGAFSPVPDYVFIHMGANDSGLAASDVTAAIDAIRTAAGTDAWIFAVVQPTGTGSSAITTGVANAAQQYRTKVLSSPVYITPGTASYWSDDAGAGSQHLNYKGQARNAAEILKLAEDYIAAAPVPFVPLRSPAVMVS